MRFELMNSSFADCPLRPLGYSVRVGREGLEPPYCKGQYNNLLKQVSFTDLCCYLPNCLDREARTPTHLLPKQECYPLHHIQSCAAERIQTLHSWLEARYVVTNTTTAFVQITRIELTFPGWQSGALTVVLYLHCGIIGNRTLMNSLQSYHNNHYMMTPKYPHPDLNRTLHLERVLT